MDGYQLDNKIIIEFEKKLKREECAAGTIEKYVRDIRSFLKWLNGGQITRESGIRWRDSLIDRGYAYSTINSMIAALNTFFAFLGWNKYKIKFLKIQHRIFRSPEKELTRDEYERLVNLAYKSGQERLGLLMETICGTGIRYLR